MIGAVGAWAVLDTVRSMYDLRGEGVRYCDKAVMLLSVSLQWMKSAVPVSGKLN